MRALLSVASALTRVAVGVSNAPLVPEEDQEVSRIAPYANQILDFTPVLAGVIAFLVVVSLHVWVSRRISRRWRGGVATWWQYWGIPIGISALVYFSVLLGVLAYAAWISAEFGTHALASVTPSLFLTWLCIGLAAALGPAVLKLVVLRR